MKIFIFGADKMNWSIDKDRQHTENFIEALDGYSVTRNPLAADVYYFVWYSQAVRYRSLIKIARLLNRKVVAVITNKITDNLDKFEALRSIISLWVSPNSFTSEFLTQQGMPHVQIPFYVSPNIFFPLKSERQKLMNELSIDPDKFKGKLVIGSFQRDSAGRDLTLQKWHKNPKLLIEIVKELNKKLDKEIVLLLAGPRRHYIINECRKHSIPFIFLGDIEPINMGEDDVIVNNLDERTINKLYAIIDLYLVTSVSEGGPKALVEACLTKTLIFSTNVGMATDILPKSQILNLNSTSSELATQIDTVLQNEGLSQQLVSELYQKASADFSFNEYKKNIASVLASQ
jgi:glycosyltransferase involved in cell wall biosynthesis